MAQARESARADEGGVRCYDLSSALKNTGVDMAFPTVTGWLLGYPTLYVFPSDDIAGAARRLSTVPLCLYSAHAKETQAPGGNGGDGAVQLCSFTVPAALGPWEEIDRCVRRWFEQLEERCSTSPAWHSAHLKSSVRPIGPVAL